MRLLLIGLRVAYFMDHRVDVAYTILYGNYRRRRENSQFTRVVGKLADRSSLVSVKTVANDCSIYDY